MELFPAGQCAGMFRSASARDLELHAELVLLYNPQQPAMPLHGQLMLIELTGPHDALLGRITAIVAQGRLISEAGEEYGLRNVLEHGTIPEDTRSRELRYRADVRLLGVLRHNDGDDSLTFAPSLRRLPHVGARAAFLSGELLQRTIAAAPGAQPGAQIGFYALGELIYSGADRRIVKRSWMQCLAPAVPVCFAPPQLIARRTFVFARAGFGKSNLIKLLLSGLYTQQPPSLALRDGSRAPVGTLVFDPNGEYFWPDATARPALCDVPALREQLVVFTERVPPSPYYGSFKAGGVRLDLRQLDHALLLGIALAPDQQGQQNVHKLKALDTRTWRQLVDLTDAGVRIDPADSAARDTFREELRALIGLRSGQDSELNAAEANMMRVVRELHDPHSNTLALLKQALAEGKLCILDISMLRGALALTLSGIVLRGLFKHNQDQFTKAKAAPIPVIAVLEEAQTVLGSTGNAGHPRAARGSGAAAYEEWVKEGRKYNLGAVLVTQQPSAIPTELLSQGDSWFVFHLLAHEDLTALKAANAHFSDDLLASLLSEPLPGNGVFWSSAGSGLHEAGCAYPIPLRVLSFQEAYRLADPTGQRAPLPDIYAARLRHTGAKSATQEP
jgi:hypothetical protein